MFYTFEELRQKAKENLSNLFGVASYREIVQKTEGKSKPPVFFSVH